MTAVFNYQFEVEAISRQGTKRNVNQDAYLCKPELGFWCVADGAGGHSRGELASQKLVESLGMIESSGSFEDLETQIKHQLFSANHYLIGLRDQEEDHMIAATATILMIQGQQAKCLWIGDSRLYLIRNKHIYKITRDHNAAEELYDRGMISLHEVSDYSHNQHLTRALGVTHDMHIESKDLMCLPGDVFILCSDGLNKVVTDPELLDITLSSGSVKESVSSMLHLALLKGTTDDTSIICVKVPSLY